MDVSLERKCRDLIAAAGINLNVQDGLIMLGKPGHTREVAQLPDSSSGRETAEFYAAATALGALEKQEGERMLRELAKLQFVDPAHAQYGGFRWYREETRINDSNAAFFIMMPLALLSLIRPERIPPQHAALIGAMSGHALAWFAKEIAHPILFYPNKILSDGALLLALSSLAKDAGHYREGVEFFTKWENYTTARGWGWGENCSVDYVKIMLDALYTACMVLQSDPSQEALLVKLEERMRQLFAYIRFHAGHEFVPTIRSYNFTGDARVDSIIWMLAGLEPVDPEAPIPADEIRKIMTMIHFENYAGSVQDQPIPRFRRERIFDDSFACTWIGRHGRMGSITRFPALPGSYQQDGWGLGWQSFPVGFCAEGENVAFLRWIVRDNGMTRTHPAESRQQGYLNTELFTGPWHPDVQTRSALEENMLLAVRSLSPIHHTAEEIADEWVLHRFRGEWTKLLVGAGDVQRYWVILKYRQSAVAITALNGLTEAGLTRVPGKIDVVQESGVLHIRQVLYCGATKSVFHPRLEAGWAAVMLDEPLGTAEIVEFLQRICLTDVTEFDGQTVRAEHMKLRRVAISTAGMKRVELFVDPCGGGV